jgi:hypothetical protein
MDFSLLLTPNYYFDANPGGDFLIGFALLAFFILTLFLGRIARNMAHGDKYLRKSIKKKFWAFPFLGVLGIISVLSRFGGVPGFSMRIFLYVILLGIVLLTGGIVFKIRREYTRRMASVSRAKK